MLLKQHHGSERFGTDFLVKQMDRYSPAWTTLMAQRRFQSLYYGAD